MRFSYTVVVLGLLWLVSTASPALAGGTVCPKGTGTYAVTNDTGQPAPTSFDALSSAQSFHMVDWTVNKPFQVVRVDVGETGTNAWNTQVTGTKLPDGSYQYVTGRRFNQVTFCVTPDTTGGVTQTAFIGATAEPNTGPAESTAGQIVPVALLGGGFGLFVLAIVLFIRYRKRHANPPLPPTGTGDDRSPLPTISPRPLGAIAP